MTDMIQVEYNKFTQMPSIPYNCILHLMNTNELIWKLLKYNDNRAYEKPNLTSIEKGALIYSGQPDINNYRVFLGWGQDDAVLGENTFLKISVLELLPSNYIYGHVTIGMEIYSHFKVESLADYTNRSDRIAQQLLEVFNGADLPGTGRLYFDIKANPRSRLSIIGAIPFRGKLITICNHAFG